MDIAEALDCRCSILSDAPAMAGDTLVKAVRGEPGDGTDMLLNRFTRGESPELRDRRAENIPKILLE